MLSGQTQTSENSKPFQLTQEHLDKFTSAHKFFLKEFGLMEWKCEYFLKEIENRYALTVYSFINKVATIHLSPEWPKEVPFTLERLYKTAKHEAQHLITSRLYTLAMTQFKSKDEVDEAEEGLVRLLDNILNIEYKEEV